MSDLLQGPALGQRSCAWNPGVWPQSSPVTWPRHPCPRPAAPRTFFSGHLRLENDFHRLSLCLALSFFLRFLP